MDSSTVALGVVVVIVVLMLMRPNEDQQCGGRRVRRSAGRLDPCTQLSSAGTGVSNRRLAKQYNQVVQANGYDDYSQAMQYMALEPEVYDSHASYSFDVGVANRGASTLTIRSDPNDAVGWVGLRRPDYQSVYAACDARVDHSEYPDQMPARTHFIL
jgi:hypothetical protein